MNSQRTCCINNSHAQGLIEKTSVISAYATVVTGLHTELSWTVSVHAVSIIPMPKHWLKNFGYISICDCCNGTSYGTIMNSQRTCCINNSHAQGLIEKTSVISAYATVVTGLHTELSWTVSVHAVSIIPMPKHWLKKLRLYQHMRLL